MTETIMGRRKSPCMGCADRYPACSDHCRKAEYLDWKAEQERIRQNRSRYSTPIWKREEGRKR